MAVEVYDEDVFSDEAIRDPYPHYQRIRDLGPVVWLEQAGIHAVTRYDDVRAVLADADTFRSGEGVMFGEVANQLTRGTTLASDNPEHDLLRKVVAHRLTPRALRDERARIEACADEVLDRVATLARDGGVVEGVTMVAQAMPMAVVPPFLGFPQDAYDRLIPWASGAIESGAPFSSRTEQAVAKAQELGRYAERLAAERGLLPDSLGADLLAAADRGEISHAQCPALLMDYFGPSLETTISVLGSALALFAENPDQWQLLREDPTRHGGAFNEVVRMESPLRAFTRVAAHDTEIDGSPVAAGTRVAVFYASANRDERKWERPDDFDILRDNADHLGLGYGVHGCAGQGLARMEFGALLTRLAEHIEHIELAGEPTRVVNGLLRAWGELPLRMHLDPSYHLSQAASGGAA